jgi:hypothetical protein
MLQMTPVETEEYREAVAVYRLASGRYGAITIGPRAGTAAED